MSESSISQKQLAANQANAQLSTGPKTETGKTKSSLNAVKTGLTGRTVLLPGDDAALYEAHIAQFAKRYEPVGDEEKNLVQSLADTEWRLLRVPALEMGIYAVGRLEFAELFTNEPEEIRKHLIEAKTFLTYQRQLSNLSLQQSRLRRQLEKDTAALSQMQAERKRESEIRLGNAACAYFQAVHRDRHHKFDLSQFGFEFSLDQIKNRALKIRPDLAWHPDNDKREAA